MPKRQAIIDEIPRLRRFARALSGNENLADDLVQDCLERALGSLHTWREGANPRNWLFTILRNVYLNHLRTFSRRPNETVLSDHHGEAVGTAPAQGDGLAVRDLAAALKALPDPYREVVVLVGLEGMNYKDTARILDVPVGTVMSRLSRGRAALKTLMESGGQGGKPPLRRVK